MSKVASNSGIDTSQPLDQLLHQVLNYALVAIGAEAGSIMLVANKEKILQIKARLGVPRANRREEPVYRIDTNSIAGWVTLQKKAYICENVATDPHFMQSRSGKNFASVLSVPIIHQDQVIAVINADAAVANKFSDRERAILESVAAEVAGAIAEKVSILDAMAEIGIQFTRLPREGGVQPVLQLIADVAVRSLGADAVTLYQYVEDTDQFPVEGTGPTIAGFINDTGPMHRRVYPGDISWTVVKKRRSGFYPNVHREDFLSMPTPRPEGAPRDRFIDREGIQSMAALLLPYRAATSPSEEIVGVMFVNYRKPHQFNIDERLALATLADYAAATILGARHEERHRVEQLKMVESISAHLAHRMSHFAAPARVAVQMLRGYVPKSDISSLELLDTVERQARVLLGLARALAKRLKDSGTLSLIEELSLETQLELALSELTTELRGVDAEQELPEHLPHVRGDAQLLRQVVRDLVRNAIEAVLNQDQPKIRITARVDEAAQRVAICITDNGPGVDPELGDKLFGPGVSTKDDHLGVGLWSCRTFMRATGGDVVLEQSLPGRTTFAIHVPMMTGSDLVSVAVPQPTEDVDVLVVDDSDVWLKTLANLVKRAGLSVRTASTYDQASHYLRQSHYRFVIVDLSLHESFGHEGLALLSELENSGAATQVIMVTAWGTAEVEERLRSSKLLKAYIDKNSLNAEDLLRMLSTNGEPAFRAN